MTLEQSICRIVLKQNNLLKTHITDNKLFSEIETIDKLLLGFENNKVYIIVANKGMGSISLINSILRNINLLYNIDISFLETSDTNQIDIDNFVKAKFNKPIFIINFLDKKITERNHHLKRPLLSDIPHRITNLGDVIISVYRPEYYGIEIWDNEEQTSTENQIEFKLLKNFKSNLGSEKLYLDKENRRVKSIKKNNALVKNWSKKFKEILNEDNK